MVDLEAIKREVKDVCRSIDSAFVSLTDKAGERAEAERQVDAIKGEIVLLEQRKVNVIESLRTEEAASREEKKKYTEIKVKYRKLINEELLGYEQLLAKHQAEMDSLRTRELSLLKAEKRKVQTEIDIIKKELSEIKVEYTGIKDSLTKLKEGISV